MVKVVLNENNEWIELAAGSKEGLYIDGYHKQNLDDARHVIKKDWDMIFVYDGYEGSGKSVKCMQDAFYCDPTLNIERITFNPTDFEKAIVGADKFTSVVLDEAYGGLSSRGAMSQINKKIVQMLTVIRAKNLFIFIVLPSFFDLDKYVALWRSRALIHVYTGNNFQRGFFKFYNSEKKKDLYVNGKKAYNYKVVKPNFMGRFTNTYVVDEEEYRKKKEKTSMDSTKDTSRVYTSSITKKIKKDVANTLKEKSLGLTQKQIAEILNVSYMTIHNYLHEDEKP